MVQKKLIIIDNRRDLHTNRRRHDKVLLDFHMENKYKEWVLQEVNFLHTTNNGSTGLGLDLLDLL